MNDLDLPPRRTMPTDVRDRLRAGLHAEPAPTSRTRAPLAVAAGVAVLAVGAAVVFQSGGAPDVRAGTAPTSSAESSTEPSQATPDNAEVLRRCLTAQGTDPTGWVAGAVAPAVPDQLVLGSKEGWLVSCLLLETGGAVTVMVSSYSPLEDTRPPGRMGSPIAGKAPGVISGIVSPRAATLEVTVGGQTYTTPEINGTFAFLSTTGDEPSWVRVYDEDHTLMYEGPFS